MTAISICIAAAILSYWARRRGVASGILAVILFGYIYGILRANLLVPASHFIFDSALLGLYGAELTTRISPRQHQREAQLRQWLLALIVLPAILAILPLQDYLIQFVGLRAAIMFLPFLLIGTRITRKDLGVIAIGLSVLNIGAFVMGVVEYVRGIEPFFPKSAVTAIMYRSNDVFGKDVYRIPSTFTSSAAYGGTMVFGVAIIGAALSASGLRRRNIAICIIGILVSLAGVLMCASRSAAAMACVPLLGLLYEKRKKMSTYIIAGVVAALFVFVIVSEPRLQRFTTLSDRTFVSERVTGTMKLSVVDLVSRYPFGNGLGAGGTSLPYFLQNRDVNLVVVENEYARIVLEEGILGLAIWLSFLTWLFLMPGTQRFAVPGTHPIFWLCLASFLSAGIGSGLLTAIPGTPLLFLMMGWLVPHPPPPSFVSRSSRVVLRQRLKRAG